MPSPGWSCSGSLCPPRGLQVPSSLEPLSVPTEARGLVPPGAGGGEQGRGGGKDGCGAAWASPAFWCLQVGGGWGGLRAMPVASLPAPGGLGGDRPLWGGGDMGRSREEGARLCRAGAGWVHMAGVGGRPDLLCYNYCLKRLRISQPFFVTNSRGLFLPPLRARAPCQGREGELVPPFPASEAGRMLPKTRLRARDHIWGPHRWDCDGGDHMPENVCWGPHRWDHDGGDPMPETVCCGRDH